ncbi:MAG: hypothetical protein UY63_C0001G0003 [Parcubacteria group bacterium GW2011_GWA2_51_10]|nr:MAG: hypothetical protein UY63_C0001G0003 [Parcubacteria group bacterium GW2011_GWA2_51_10]
MSQLAIALDMGTRIHITTPDGWRVAVDKNDVVRKGAGFAVRRGAMILASLGKHDLPQFVVECGDEFLARAAEAEAEQERDRQAGRTVPKKLLALA